MANPIIDMLRKPATDRCRKAASAVALGMFGFLLMGIAPARAQVALSASTLPAVAQPGVQSVRITGSSFPAGAIAADNITVSLAPATPGAGPSAQVTAAGFARIAGTTANVTFVVPTSLTVSTPTAYRVSISESNAPAFSSRNTSNLTIDPSAIVGLSPATGQQGQSLTAVLAGSYTNFAQGATTANFGPGISVGGAAANTAGPVTVTGPTTATAQLAISSAATVATNTVIVTTGKQVSTSSFSITAATAQDIDLAITKSHTGNFTQGQNGVYAIGVSNTGPGATSGTVTVTDTLPTGMSVVSMGGTGWECTGTTCTTSNILGSGSAYPTISLTVAVAANAATSLTNSVAVSGGGTDSNLTNNIAVDPTTIVPVPASVTATAGTPQSTTIDTAFSSTLQATVRDAGGNPVSGVVVTFAAPTSGASGTFAGGVKTAVTNNNGVATAAVFTANATAGGYSVTASVAGVGTAASYSLTNNTGAAASITATAGTPQSAPISTAFGVPLQATVRDAGGNPVSGVLVTFATPGSGASGTFAGGVVTATTNANGTATAATFTANGTSGSYNVTASAPGVSPSATFALTNTSGTPASISATGGTPQSTVVLTAFGSTLQATVKDAGNNPVSGVTVTFAVPGTGASATFAGGNNTAVTNTSGVATSAMLTANATAGSYSVTASVSGVGTPAPFALTNTAGAPASIVASGGTPQSATIDTVFASALQATVRDAGGNPVSGVVVMFTVPTSGASATFASGNTAVTNTSGVATSSALTSNSTAGGYNVTAAVTGVATPASFSLTNLAGAAASIAANAGTPQSTQVNTAFATNLQALVKDSGGNPVSGTIVTFTSPATADGAFGGSLTTTASTNVNGLATASVFTAGGTATSYTVSASAPGVTPNASFALTNTVGAAASIAATAGVGQSATVGTAFTTTLQATVKDASNNPVSGASVTFTSPSASDGTFAGGLLSVSENTNANGVATATAFTAGTSAGGYNVSASVAGVTPPATFSLTNTAGAANTIAVYAGTGQSTVVGTAFATQLSAIVRDSDSNPVSGATVTFAAPGTGASGTFAGGANTAVTNANGIATAVVFTANATAGAYSVTASATGVGTPTSFSLTNTPGTPSTVAVYSGNNQSAAVNTAFANLEVVVRDSGGNGVSGVTVTFAAPASGASGTFAGGVTIATTNASGIAIAPAFTANATPGSYQVTASVSGVALPAVFTLTNTQANIATLNPASGTLAQTLNVVVAGTATHFVQGTTTAYFGTGITVNTVTVASATSATVNITIAPTTTLGARTVTMTTGGEVATDTNGFSVTQGSATILSVNPATGAQAAQVNVIVTGSNTNFTQGVTTASFGPNIGINSVTVSSLTSATVNITIAGNATLGAQTVTLTTGGEIASLTNAFTIASGTAQITTVAPGSGKQGDTADSVAITGQSTHFAQGTTTASFGSGITVTSLTVNSATSATAVVAIATNAAIGNRTMTLTTGSEVVNSAADAFSVAAGVPSATASPNFGIQGTNPTIVINGSFTSFVAGTTTVSFNDPNIAVGSVTVNGPTQLSVPIQINTNTGVGGRTITMNTNGNTVTAAFNVVAGEPAITLINPNVGVPDSTVTANITGNFTGWTSGVTQVSFGSGIAVGGGTAGQPGPVTVNNSGSITASLAIASDATIGSRTVTVTTDSEIESVSSGFTVQTCTTTGAAGILNTPIANATNVPLNAIVQVEFNAPINRSTVNTTDFYIYDTVTGQHIPATVSVDASGRIMTLVPSVSLSVGREYYAQYGNVSTGNQIMDTCGNLISGGEPYFYFTTTFSAETGGPVLLASSPQAGDTVAENANVVVQFSEPINPITQAAGFVVSSGGTPVAGTYTPSPDYTEYTFVPGSPLAASTVYTVTTTSALQDGAGNALTNPGSYTFTTTSATDTTHGTIPYSDPYANEIGVSTVVQPTIFFSKIVDPITVTSAVFDLIDATTGRRIPATITVAANRLSASLTPLQPLQPNTQYNFGLSTSTVYDLSGNYFYGTSTYFYTGSGTVTTPATVATISPANGATGTPVNTQVVAVISAPVDGGTINNSSIVVKAGGTPVAGTVTLGSDQMTLTFVPTANLSVSTTYTVTVGGFLDANENAVATATSSFTTGSSGTPQTGALTLVSATPANGATGVSNTSPVAITFSAAVDPATIGNILVRDESNGYYEISGTWAVSGGNPAQAVFTPTSPYPASAVIQVYTQDQVRDLAGNADNAGVVTTFTAAATVDSSTFQVVSISPANGTTGVGRNATIAITFNKSVNQSSINASPNALQLFAGDQNIGRGGVTFSSDDRTITFTQTVPAGVTVNVNATPLITDLSGNPLVNFTSEYQTANDITGTAPAVVQMLPAKGASDVLQGTPITLYTNGASLDPSTVNNSTLYVAQNGVLVEGTLQVASGGQSVTFTPGSPFAYGALVQVFLTSGITDIYGNTFNSYTGQFTVQGNPSSIAPQFAPAPIRYNPLDNATGVPTNVLPQMKFDQQLLASSVSSASVQLVESCNGAQIPGIAAVVGDGTILQFTPSSALPSSCNGNPAEYYLQINNGTTKVTNLDGVAVSGNPYFYFTVGNSPVTTAPTVLSVAPSPGATNVGVNAVIYVQFSRVIDPLSVTGSTITISGASQTIVPQTITFDSTSTFAIIQPETPLPASTQITVSVNGVTDAAGNAVTPYSSTFNTGSSPVTAPPVVIAESVASGATGIPINGSFSVQFSEPMVPSSFAPSTFYVYDTVTDQPVPAAISVSADGTTATLSPASPLNIDRQYYYLVNGARDMTGNAVGDNYWYFTTESVASALLPAVTAVNPSNGLTAVPTNTVVQLLFNEPIAPDTLSQVTINQGGTPISATAALSRNNTVVSLTPSQTLLPNTAYTVTATNVVDFAGHTQTAAFSSGFTTGALSDITYGSVAPSYIPEGGDSNVALNIQPTFFFTKQVNPLSIYPSIFVLTNANTGAIISSTTTVAPNQLSVTLTPLSNLQPETRYNLNLTTTYDVAGNYMSGAGITFTTGAAPTTTGANVASVSPADNMTGVPLNAVVTAVMSAPVSQNTLGSSPITVKAGGNTVAGTTTLASDEMTLTFTPAASLSASTVYTVTVGGFSDQNGNAVQSSTTTFTTGTTTSGSFAVSSITPANGTTLASNNSTPIVLTFNQAVNPSTITNVLVRDQSQSYDEIAGSWSVNGAVATFTPLSPYPANHTIRIDVQNNVLNLAGGFTSFESTFTAANSADTTAPTVTSVTPLNGSTNVGDYPTVVLTFSKSISPQTVNTTSISVFAGDSQFNYSTTFAANGMAARININSALPPNTVITVSASSLVTDLSGNALTPFQSQFTTGTQLPTQNQGPQVTSQIPANGAADVSQGTPITIYTQGTAIDSSTVNDSTIQVSQNGQLVTGSLALIGDGHAIQFTPSSAFNYGALVQVFVNTSVMDIDGYALQSAFTGQFTVQGDPASTVPVWNGSNPLANSSVAPNVLPQMRFDQQILASSLSASSVQVNCNGTIAGTPSLIGAGNIVQFTPSADLPASTSNCYLQITGGTSGVTNIDGVPVSGSPYFYFNTGTTDDHTHPTVAAIGPPAGTQNVGINAVIYVQFSEPINPLSVTGSTIAITGASQTVVPATISFDSTDMTAIIQPATPLPPSATMTITVNGVADPEGNTVTPASSTFVTAADPVTSAPSVTAYSYIASGTVPLNTTAFSMTFNRPMNPLSINPGTLVLYDTTQGKAITGGTITDSSDMMTFTLTVPAGTLNAGDEFYLQSINALDITGNSAGNQYQYGYIGSINDTTAPTVTEVSPETSLTNVPTNAQPQLEFSQAMSNVSAQMGIELLQGSNVVPATVALSRGNLVATITPNDPLAESTTYTISASGVQDVQGTAMASPYTSSFTTSSAGINLAQPTVVSVTPANGTISVPSTVQPTVVFSAPMNPLNFDASLGYGVLEINSSSVVVPATVSFSADGKTVTFTPASPLTSGTTYKIYIYYYYITDVAGNRLAGTSSTTFTVQ